MDQNLLLILSTILLVNQVSSQAGSHQRSTTHKFSEHFGTYTTGNAFSSSWATHHKEQVQQMAQKLRSEFNLHAQGDWRPLPSTFTTDSKFTFRNIAGKSQEELDLLAKHMTEQMIEDMRSGKLVYSQIMQPNWFENQAAYKLESLDHRVHDMHQTQQELKPFATQTTETETRSEHFETLANQDKPKIIYPSTYTRDGISYVQQQDSTLIPVYPDSYFVHKHQDQSGLLQEQHIYGGEHKPGLISGHESQQGHNSYKLKCYYQKPNQTCQYIRVPISTEPGMLSNKPILIPCRKVSGINTEQSKLYWCRIVSRSTGQSSDISRVRQIPIMPVEVHYNYEGSENKDSQQYVGARYIPSHNQIYESADHQETEDYLQQSQQRVPVHHQQIFEDSKYEEREQHHSEQGQTRLPTPVHTFNEEEHDQRETYRYTGGQRIPGYSQHRYGSSHVDETERNREEVQQNVPVVIGVENYEQIEHNETQQEKKYVPLPVQEGVEEEYDVEITRERHRYPGGRRIPSYSHHTHRDSRVEEREHHREESQHHIPLGVHEETYGNEEERHETEYGQRRVPVQAHDINDENYDVEITRERHRYPGGRRIPSYSQHSHRDSTVEDREHHRNEFQPRVPVGTHTEENEQTEEHHESQYGQSQVPVQVQDTNEEVYNVEINRERQRYPGGRRIPSYSQHTYKDSRVEEEEHHRDESPRHIPVGMHTQEHEHTEEEHRETEHGQSRVPVQVHEINEENYDNRETHYYAGGRRVPGRVQQTYKESSVDNQEHHREEDQRHVPVQIHQEEYDRRDESRERETGPRHLPGRVYHGSSYDESEHVREEGQQHIPVEYHRTEYEESQHRLEEENQRRYPSGVYGINQSEDHTNTEQRNRSQGGVHYRPSYVSSTHREGYNGTEYNRRYPYRRPHGTVTSETSQTNVEENTEIHRRPYYIRPGSTTVHANEENRTDSDTYYEEKPSIDIDLTAGHKIEGSDITTHYSPGRTGFTTEYNKTSLYNQNSTHDIYGHRRPGGVIVEYEDEHQVQEEIDFNQHGRGAGDRRYQYQENQYQENLYEKHLNSSGYIRPTPTYHTQQSSTRYEEHSEEWRRRHGSSGVNVQEGSSGAHQENSSQVDAYKEGVHDGDDKRRIENREPFEHTEYGSSVGGATHTVVDSAIRVTSIDRGDLPPTVYVENFDHEVDEIIPGVGQQYPSEPISGSHTIETLASTTMYPPLYTAPLAPFEPQGYGGNIHKVEIYPSEVGVESTQSVHQNVMTGTSPIIMISDNTRESKPTHEVGQTEQSTFYIGQYGAGHRTYNGSSTDSGQSVYDTRESKGVEDLGYQERQYSVGVFDNEDDMQQRQQTFLDSERQRLEYDRRYGTRRHEETADGSSSHHYSSGSQSYGHGGAELDTQRMEQSSTGTHHYGITPSSSVQYGGGYDSQRREYSTIGSGSLTVDSNNDNDRQQQSSLDQNKEYSYSGHKSHGDDEADDQQKTENVDVTGSLNLDRQRQGSYDGSTSHGYTSGSSSSFGSRHQSSSSQQKHNLEDFGSSDGQFRVGVLEIDDGQKTENLNQQVTGSYGSDKFNNANQGYTRSGSSSFSSSSSGGQRFDDGQFRVGAFEVDDGQKTENLNQQNTGSNGSDKFHNANQGYTRSGSSSFSSSSSGSQRFDDGQFRVGAFEVDDGQKTENLNQETYDLRQELEGLTQQAQGNVFEAEDLRQANIQQQNGYGSGQYSTHYSGSYGSSSSSSGGQSAYAQQTHEPQEVQAQQVEEITEAPGFWQKVGKKAKDIFG